MSTFMTLEKEIVKHAASIFVEENFYRISYVLFSAQKL